MMEASNFVEPDEITAPRSCSDRIGPVLASRSNPSVISVAITVLAASETIVVSWDPLLCNSSANLIPYITPDAPVIPNTILKGADGSEEVLIGLNM